MVLQIVYPIYNILANTDIIKSEESEETNNRLTDFNHSKAEEGNFDQQNGHINYIRWNLSLSQTIAQTYYP